MVVASCYGILRYQLTLLVRWVIRCPLYAITFFTPFEAKKFHIIISYPDAGLGHCPEGQGPDIKHKF